MCTDLSLQNRGIHSQGLIKFISTSQASRPFGSRQKEAATMPKESITSMVFATVFVVLTVSVIGGMITMIIVYQNQIGPLNPTPPPTILPTTEAPPPVMRLPKNLIPDNYDIWIKIELYPKIIEVVNVTSPNQTLNFTGKSTVSFYCAQSTRSIYLQSKDLEVSSYEVMNKASNRKLSVTNTILHQDQSDFLEIQLEEALESGMNYSLSLEFKGEISENLDSLYLSTYHEGLPAYEGDTNSLRYIAATDMEPTGARKLFPCFDEPEMKATFKLTIKHRLGTTALANAGIYPGSSDEGEWKISEFYPTPRMSTYLFAFTVLPKEFKSKESAHKNVTMEIPIYARPAAIDAGYADYAASISGEILTFYKGHFGISYGHHKLDQIALPDLGPAAMENWGLVTYQEAGLLYEEGVSSLLHKEVVASLIAHEFAHQWFGNLVTMKWWNDIWLNEGFSTYMSYFAVDAVQPSFKMRDAFILHDLHTAFEEDALASSHPLSPSQEDIHTTYEIIEMFNAITYSKGAMVLRMLANVKDVGEEIFNNGVKKYLQAFANKNADQNDLWEKMQEAIEDNHGAFKVARMMKTWTDQAGYPVITINTTNGEMQQKRFLFDDSAESNLTWIVPIRAKSSEDDEINPYLLTAQIRVNSDFKSPRDGWILLNVNCTGYYRVNYDPENWDRLLTQLKTKTDPIPLINRGQLIDDAFNLARAKQVSVTLALNSTLFLINETAYIPWESAVRNLEYFTLMFDRSEVYGPIQIYLQKQVSVLYDFFSNYTNNNTVPDDHSLQHNQITAIEVACSNGLPACLQMAKDKYAAWMTNNANRIHPNLRSVIYCQALAEGGKKEWDFAWEKYLNSKETSEKDQLRQALSCTKKIWLLNRYLQDTLNPEKIRLMDVASTINHIARNVAGQALAWNFIRAHWEYVSQGDAGSLIMTVTKRFSTEFELEELESFVKNYKLGPSTMTAYQALEQTELNIQWVKENKDSVLEWFENATS